MTENSLLAVSCQYGIYNVQTFVQWYFDQMLPEHWTIYQDELQDVLQGPDNENYIDSWVTVSDNCRVIIDGITYCIHENDGDIWLIPESEINEIPESY